MTLVTGTVEDLGYDAMTGTLWARPARFRSDGGVVLAPERKPFPIEGGVVSAELAPGPAVLEIRVGTHARGTFEVVIPDQASISLADLLDTVFAWEPAQVSQFVAERELAEAAKMTAVAAAGDAEGFAGTATTAAQQAGADRAHVDAIREQLDEAAQGNVAPYLTTSALNATYAAQVPTATAMLATSLPVGSLVQTHGHHAAGDGGACRYVVVAAKVKSYDLAGTGRAFRPSVNGTLHPKMFGTVNNGTALDNLPLQACYDYAADLGIDYIDGQGLTYNIGTVNPLDVVQSGWAHTGAMVRSGRTVANATFRTANGSTDGTCAAAVDMINDGRPTYFRNCTFDGNRANVAAPSPREDGGAHLVYLRNAPFLALAANERDFTPTGNVYFEDCRFKGNFSYGVVPQYIDATVKFTDCAWDANGIAVLMHATRVVVDGAKVTVGAPRTGKVPNPFAYEAEFGHLYSGSKKLSAEFSRVDYSSTVAENALVKIHYAPMQGTKWSTISFDRCHATGTATLLSTYSGVSETNPATSTLEIDNLQVLSSTSASPGLVTLTTLRASNKFTKVNNLVVENLAAHNRVNLLGADVGVLELRNPVFGPGTTINTASETLAIGTLRVSDAAGTLGTNGILRGFANVTVDKLEILGGEFTQAGQATVECVLKDALVRSAVVHSPATGDRRFLFPRGTTANVRFLDVVLTAATATGPLVFGTFASGYVHLRNTRHVSGPTPTTAATGLPAGRVVVENVAPLIPAA